MNQNRSSQSNNSQDKIEKHHDLMSLTAVKPSSQNNTVNNVPKIITLDLSDSKVGNRKGRTIVPKAIKPKLDKIEEINLICSVENKETDGFIKYNNIKSNNSLSS